jgi:rare lipoprotein A
VNLLSRCGCAAGIALLLLAGCSREVVRPQTPTPLPPVPNPAQVPDAVPRAEPRSPNGNPPFYDALGQRYFVLSSAAGYAERGVASWYGPGFHSGRTATGETYDMYAMTAAHKTLPLPCYAQVTNLSNGHSIVVRINDRGPFVANRLIDLSYVAAAKLDMLKQGTTLVEVRTLDGPGTPLPAPVAARGDLYIQVGAFNDPQNADRLLSTLRRSGIGPAFMRADDVNGKHFYRVRVGPVPDVAEFDRLVEDLRGAGIPDARLALD